MPNEVPIEKVKWEASDVSSWGNEHMDITTLGFRLKVEAHYCRPVEENYL